MPVPLILHQPSRLLRLFDTALFYLRYVRRGVFRGRCRASRYERHQGWG